VVTVARELAGFMWDINRPAMSLAIPQTHRQRKRAIIERLTNI
jgi:hypothetical protein